HFFLNNIDQTQDPCEDFNKFSCGNFLKNRRIPSDETYIDIFAELTNNLADLLSDLLEEHINFDDIEATKNAKQYYKSCLNEDLIETNGLDNLLNIINKELGGSSLTQANYDVNNENTFDKIVKFAKWGLKPLFDLYISSNPKNPDSYVMRLQQANWFLTKKTYQEGKPAVIEAYKKLIKNIFNEILPNNLFIFSIALATLDAEQKRNQTYQNFTISNFNRNYTGFDWQRFIVQELFGEYPSLNVTENEPLLVIDFSYLRKMLDVYQNALKDNKDDLHNLFIWSFVKSRTSFLPKKFRDFQLDFDKIYSGTTSIPKRSRTCSNEMSEKMPYAVGRLYVKNYFKEEAKNDTEDMIKNIREEFKLMLTENEWMDQESKAAAREKLEFIDNKIGYPDFTFNNTYLEDLYKNYIFDETNYLLNSLIITKNEYEISFSKLRSKRSRKEWIIGPAVVNAFYNPNNNDIGFPAGIFQAPFYDTDLPKYLNYGGIGTAIGHEITHGFDDLGRRFNKIGAYFTDDEPGLWTEETIKNYKEKAECFIDQYDGYKAEQVGENLNGYQTLGENIADNGGIKESFRAYVRWAEKNGPEPLLPGLPYNQEQLFFINYAQL
ncbi:unnamed protein product, partial [Brachionus calyciflorus]